MFEKGEELAAAAASAVSADAGSASTLPANLRHGAAVTLAYFTLYYIFIAGQIITKKKLGRMLKAQDKKVAGVAAVCSNDRAKTIAYG